MSSPAQQHGNLERLHHQNGSPGTESTMPLGPFSSLATRPPHRGGSKSPTRGGPHHRDGRNNRHKSKSRSPTRDGHNHNGNRRRGNTKSPNRNRTRNRKPAKMTVIVNRTDLWDAAAQFIPDEINPDFLPKHDQDMPINQYRFVQQDALPSQQQQQQSQQPHQHQHQHRHLVATTHVTHRIKYDANFLDKVKEQSNLEIIDTITPNPYPPDVVKDKYWAQRRRLFSRYDDGIWMDPQGWYSVTPEIIADHVAKRIAQLASTCHGGITLLDAFCGCGGNSIAFGKIPPHLIKQVVCLDTDRSKLIKAAHNAAIYGIPTNKLVFVECNAIFAMRHIYKNGMFMLDQPRAAMPPYMPPPVEQATYSGYKIGGLELLPRHIDAIFMDPPWGGVDYEVVGKNGYCLEKHMKIKVSPDDPSNNNKSGSNNTSASSQGQSSTINNKKDDLDAGDYVSNDFFDTISNSTTKNQTSRSRSNSHEQQLSAEARKANFNKRDDNDSGEFINGADLIQIAAEATCSRVVIYDVPRNMNRLSLGKSALKAGYHGNIKLEEHYLNGRLKTATAYMGADFTFMLDPNFTDD